jgi:hypothetical protein
MTRFELVTFPLPRGCATSAPHGHTSETIFEEPALYKEAGKLSKNRMGYLQRSAYSVISSLKLELPRLDKHKQDMSVHHSTDISVTFFDYLTRPLSNRPHFCYVVEFKIRIYYADLPTG